MEVFIFELMLTLLCYGTIAISAISDIRATEVSDLRQIFIEEIREIENRYEEKLEALRNEMIQNNKMLQKSVNELRTELENERISKSGEIQQIQMDFVEKETKLKVEIDDLKNQLMAERKDRNQEINLLNAMIVEPMSEGKAHTEIKEKDGVAFIGTRSTKMNQMEGAKKHKKKRTKETGLKRQTSVYGSTQVAFSARLTTGATSMSANQDIVFNDVLLNVGSAYHNSHGTFVAPVSGVYFFTTSLLALGTTPHHAKLVKDGHELVRVDFNDDDNFDDSSQAVVVQLQKGNIVAVQNADYNGMLYAGSNYSTFSGFLLYEIEDVSPAVGK